MSQNTICKICNRQKATYTCPKCHIPYCGITCYQHSSHEKCSEKFYEANVLEELQQQNASEEEKKAMFELLKQFEENCAEDDRDLRHQEEVANLASRLGDVDLDGDPQKIWERLSQEERDEFTKIVKEQNCADLVTEWLPWWTYKKQKKPLVTEVRDEEDETSDDQEDLSEYRFPEISTQIQPFNNFSKSEPSACIKYNAVNILLAYTYIVMRYNGEHQDMSEQCAEDLVSLSDVLLKAQNCNTAGEAVRGFCSSLKKLEDLFISLDYISEVLDSLVLILHGPEELPTNDFMLMAVSDITQLLENARMELKNDPSAKEGRKQLALVKRKLEFYSGWVLSHAKSDVPLLTAEILVEKELLLAEDKSHKETGKIKKKADEKAKAESKPRIEVLT